MAKKSRTNESSANHGSKKPLAKKVDSKQTTSAKLLAKRTSSAEREKRANQKRLAAASSLSNRSAGQQPNRKELEQKELATGFTVKQLSELCYRVATSLEAGIDIRRIWRSEADRATGRTQKVFTAVADSVESGETISAALTPWKGFFPRLFVAMVNVGEATGTLGEVLRRLSQHYDHRTQVARKFRSQIAWPLLQLFAALTVVGLMILIGGVIETAPGKPLDLLGFGLTGMSGLVTYAGLLGAIVIGALLLKGYLDRRPYVRAAWIEFWTNQPVIGPCLKKISLARIAWGLHLTLNVDMDLRRVAPIVLNISGNRYYAKHGAGVADEIGNGNPLSVAFAKTEVFPREFLDALAVAEESGQLVESMQRLSRQYEEEAESAMTTLSAVLAGFIWAGVATMIVILIFRIFNFYTKTIYDALEGF